MLKKKSQRINISEDVPPPIVGGQLSEKARRMLMGSNEEEQKTLKKMEKAAKKQEEALQEQERQAEKKREKEDRKSRGSDDRRSRSSKISSEVIVYCLRYLENYGFDTEGILRVSGSSVEVKALKRMLDNGKMNVLEDETADIHVVSGVLKQTLKEMEEPLLTNRHYTEFIGVGDLEDPKERIDKILSLVVDIPPTNRGLLSVLLHTMKKICDNCEVNKMTSTNVATVLAPSILRMENLPINQVLCDSSASIRTVETMIEECLTINDVLGKLPDSVSCTPPTPRTMRKNSASQSRAFIDPRLSPREGPSTYEQLKSTQEKIAKLENEITELRKYEMTLRHQLITETTNSMQQNRKSMPNITHKPSSSRDGRLTLESRVNSAFDSPRNIPGLELNGKTLVTMSVSADNLHQRSLSTEELSMIDPQVKGMYQSLIIDVKKGLDLLSPSVDTQAAQTYETIQDRMSKSPLSSCLEDLASATSLPDNKGWVVRELLEDALAHSDLQEFYLVAELLSEVASNSGEDGLASLIRTWTPLLFNTEVTEAQKATSYLIRRGKSIVEVKST
ncbi:RhoGAP domain-containing protein [Planoprotostelium fungivorum]|uniref:RhoGAP domain-containing protein n=1 Tax=Planoprotostelium fungivorum TaxID=1890364 RepID=A0A2P6MST3_9EUKA|nr:RhoGAP domain-containing protein [Planoprotostelium fungivorum]